MTLDLNEREQFFYEHAGYACRPGESEVSARLRNASKLASAEKRMIDGLYYVSVEVDVEPWDGDVPYDGPLWNVDLYSVTDSGEPVLLGSLGGVAAENCNDPYVRVVAAELALEYIPN